MEQLTEPGYIDTHVHVWTSDTERYKLAPGFRREHMRPPSFVADELLVAARPCGVGRFVLIQMDFYGHDNSFLLDTMLRYPGLFSGIAVVDETTRPQVEMRRLAKHGIRGFRISSGPRAIDRWLDHSGMTALWRCGAEENLVICLLVNPDALSAIDRTCRKFPETPVVIDHFARIGIDGFIREEDVERLCSLAQHKMTMVKLSAFYALGKKEPPYLDLIPLIRRLLDAYGPERLMWGTDCPFQVQDRHTYLDSVALIRDRIDFLSAQDRQWLLRKTAERLFFPD